MCIHINKFNYVFRISLSLSIHVRSEKIPSFVIFFFLFHTSECQFDRVKKLATKSYDLNASLNNTAQQIEFYEDLNWKSCFEYGGPMHVSASEWSHKYYHETMTSVWIQTVIGVNVFIIWLFHFHQFFATKTIFKVIIICTSDDHQKRNIAVSVQQIDFRIYLRWYKYLGNFIWVYVNFLYFRLIFPLFQPTKLNR